LREPLRRVFKLAAITLLLSACGNREAKETVNAQPEIFPDYRGVTIPVNIAPMNFGIEDAEHMQVVLKNAQGETLEASGKEHIELNEKRWHLFISQGGDIEVTVSAWTQEHPEGATYAPFTMHVSMDEVDPWISYRLLPPGYEGWNRMGIYQREMSSFKVSTIVDNSQNNHGCLNCHAYSQYDPNTMMFHSRAAGGGTVIWRNGKLEKVDLKSMGPGKHGSYNAWHPSGKYIAFSSNSTHQAFYGKSRDKIEVYDLWSYLIIYDVERHEVLGDERFLDSLNLEIFPTFSPDGKWLYFSTAHPVNMPKEVGSLFYSLIRVPFNEADGTLGEQVDTLYSGAQMGKTALMPRVSPDGRYVIFTVSDCGAFNLYHTESDFVMMDLQSGELVDCHKINSTQMESHHTWSSNGRWMIFSTKRVDTKYTRLFIAHWDGKQWGKPFLLPQQDPEENTMLMMAYNLPEFMNGAVKVSRDKLTEILQPEK